MLEQLLRGSRRELGLIRDDGTVAFAETQRAESVHAAIKDLIRNSRRGELGVDDVLRRVVLLFSRQKIQYRHFLLGESSEWHSSSMRENFKNPSVSRTRSPNPHNIDLPNAMTLLRLRIPRLSHKQSANMLARAGSLVSANQVFQEKERSFVVKSTADTQLHYNVTLSVRFVSTCDCKTKDPFCTHKIAVGLFNGHLIAMVTILPIVRRTVTVGLEGFSDSRHDRRAGLKPGHRLRSRRLAGSPERSLSGDDDEDDQDALNMRTFCCHLLQYFLLGY
jgi:hypothetical protein